MSCFAKQLSQGRSATMAVSWIERAKLFKSPVRVVAAILLRSRETQVAKKRHWQVECQKQKAKIERQDQQIAEQRRDISQLKRQVQVLECELAEAGKARPLWPSDPPIPGHGYGPRLICLAVLLAQVVGIRGAAQVIKIFSLGWVSISKCRTSRRSACG
jgi:hypothetical protein